MPEESLHGRGVFLPPHHLLSDGEIELLVRVFANLGVRKLRLTGGEPLLRPGFIELVKRISAIDGITDLALTTNGVLFKAIANGKALKSFPGLCGWINFGKLQVCRAPSAPAALYQATGNWSAYGKAHC